MRKYFGTDGVRGEANVELTPELAFQLGRCGGYVLREHAEPSDEKPRVLVARDPRISGQLLEHALIAGLLSIGMDVFQLGVISTPGVSYLTRATGATAGVMISASHNPAEDNGIKFFGSDGFKLSDAQEHEIEALMDRPPHTLPRPSADGLGTVSDYLEGASKYLEFLESTIAGDLSGLKVCVDAANGATSPLVNRLFADLEVDFQTMATSPDGLNINDGVGSTHPEGLAQMVLDEQADVGIAFDGDGDRCIAVDEKGQIVDGDQIMFICAKYYDQLGLLEDHTIVATVMSNLGFYKGLEALGIQVKTTDVGDRYVVQEMREGSYNLGGEQSGHIIFMDYNTTGDGLLTAIQLLYIMKQTGKTLSELAGEMTTYPQILINVPVTREGKQEAMASPNVQAVIADVTEQMAGDGRILVRPSGTENLLRVMVEARTDELADSYANQIADSVREEFGI